MTLDFLAMGVAAFGWGALTDRFGPRPVVLAGAVLLGAGLALASRATSLLEFQLVYGVLVGAAAGAVFAPTMATVTGWFDKHRSLAVSLVSAGMGMAPMTISPLGELAASSHDWRTAQLMIGDRRLGAADPGGAVLRRAPGTARPAWPRCRRGAEPGMTVGQALRSPQFLILGVDLLLLLRHALRADLPHRELCHGLRHPGAGGGHDLQRRGLRAVSSAACCSASPATGSAPSDGGLRAARPGAGRGRLLLHARRSASSTPSPSIFGMAYGGVMPLYAVIAREYFPMRIMGTVIGATAHDRQPRHVAGAGGRRLDLRHLRHLRLALSRLARHGPRRRAASRSSSRRFPRASGRGGRSRPECLLPGAKS